MCYLRVFYFTKQKILQSDHENMQSGDLEVVDHVARTHPNDIAVLDKMDRGGLEVAAYLGLDHVVSHLIYVHGFDVNKVSGKSKMTALHWAALEGRLFIFGHTIIM